MSEILDAVKNTVERQNVPRALAIRAAEVASCFLSWTLMAAAHRRGYDGLYEADNYTPLTFLLSMAILDFCFVIALVVAQQAKIGDARLVTKVELYGSAACCAGLVLGFVAGAASSTQLHDEFGGSSTCAPSGAGHKAKAKASYFCARVDAAVAFAFFGCLASVASLGFVLRARGVSLRSEPREDEEALAGDYDNVLRDPDGRTFEPAPFASAAPMEGIGADDVKPQDAAIDL